MIINGSRSIVETTESLFFFFYPYFSQEMSLKNYFLLIAHEKQPFKVFSC